jgi:hypothetical protein
MIAVYFFALMTSMENICVVKTVEAIKAFSGTAPRSADIATMVIEDLGGSGHTGVQLADRD